MRTGEYIVLEDRLSELAELVNADSKKLHVRQSGDAGRVLRNCLFCDSSKKKTGGLRRCRNKWKKDLIKSHARNRSVDRRGISIRS